MRACMHAPRRRVKQASAHRRLIAEGPHSIVAGADAAQGKLPPLEEAGISIIDLLGGTGTAGRAGR